MNSSVTFALLTTQRRCAGYITFTFLSMNSCTGSGVENIGEAFVCDVYHLVYHVSPATRSGKYTSLSPDTEGAGSLPARMLNCRD